MAFVFYDTETTGTNIAFDQILQFAAVLTDDDLNEIDRFEARCRLLPWVVPSPTALKITGIRISQLHDANLPSYFEMMRAVAKRLTSWSPAKFIGYNSINFDEPFLQNAFWQNLLPPWLTVMGGNSRLDLLPILQIQHRSNPKNLVVPTDKNGRLRFKLDMLAPANGFHHKNAHDAMGDVEATIFLARIVASLDPDLWKIANDRSFRPEVEKLLSQPNPLMIFEQYGSPLTWMALPIGINPINPSARIMARLDFKWPALLTLNDQALGNALENIPWPLHSVATNKSPLIFTQTEAETIFGMRVSELENLNVRFFLEHPDQINRLLSVWRGLLKPKPANKHLEQMIFDGFASREDESRMRDFQRGNWIDRLALIRSFADIRFRQLAQRIVYSNCPQYLSGNERKNIKIQIRDRLTKKNNDKMLWRTIPEARIELQNMTKNTSHMTEIKKFLDSMETALTSNNHPS